MNESNLLLAFFIVLFIIVDVLWVMIIVGIFLAWLHGRCQEYFFGLWRVKNDTEDRVDRFGDRCGVGVRDDHLCLNTEQER